MNKIKLPSMVEYVKMQSPNLPFVTRFVNCDNFANFLSQEPNIGMVVAAVFENREWRVLTEPKEYFEWCKWGDFTKHGKSITPKCKEYHTALDNVIFEGFEYDGSEDGFIYVKNGETLLIFDTENKTLMLLNNMLTDSINTIEQLTHYNLTLTSKFAKELGLI
jgi:hypothetical protein